MAGEGIWIALIVAVVTGTLSPALLLLLKGRSERRQRIDDAERESRTRREDAAIRKAERDADWAREDAREGRSQELLHAIKKQTDGLVTQVSTIAEARGRLSGEAAATAAGEATAATLALGQQQGRDAERESAATHQHHQRNDADEPLPVADDRTAKASERVADASEALASATTRVADAAEVKK